MELLKKEEERDKKIIKKPMSNKSEKKTLIGEYLGTIEEFLPGEGTYAEGGKIFSSRIGKKILNKEEHLIRVEGKSPFELRVGQIVYGEVSSIRNNSVGVLIRKIQGFKDEGIEIPSSIYVSNISETYVKKPEDAFGIGDIVKGKIIKIEYDLIDITTKGDFGVVKAFCKRCRAPLKKSLTTETFKDRLICENCGHREMRKIAKDYENVTEI